MSNRQRYFIIDKALAQLLQKEDEDFYGGMSRELLDSDRSARDSRLSSAVYPEILREHSSNLKDDDEEEQFLDRQVDPKGTAACYLDREPSASSSDGDDGKERERSPTGGEASRTQLTRHQCGCAKSCLHHLDANDTEQVRLSM